jgi:DNA ligase-1
MVFMADHRVTFQTTTQNFKDNSDLSTFASFAQLCENIHLTSLKAEKSIAIAQYLTSLSVEELPIATRWIAGHIFPYRERRTLNVSNLVILNALSACAGIPCSFAKERLAQIGDIGLLAHELFCGGLTVSVTGELALCEVFLVIDELSHVQGTRAKSKIILQALRRASPLEAKYIVRLIGGDLAIGAHERDVEDAISRWRNINFGRVQSANILLGDIGETVLLCLAGTIDEVRMRLYTPIKYMHAAEAYLRDDLSRVLPAPFVIEDKFDGIRAQVHIGLDTPQQQINIGAVYDCLRVVIFSDQLKDITAEYSDLVPGLSALMNEQAGTVDAVGVILDGIIVPISNGKIQPFSHLKKRIQTQLTNPGEISDVSVGFVAFDLIFAEGRSLIQEEWYVRSTTLDKISFDNVTTFRTRPINGADVQDIHLAHAAAIGRGSLGVIVKNPRSSYLPDRRGEHWIKITCQSLLVIEN